MVRITRFAKYDPKEERFLFVSAKKEFLQARIEEGKKYDSKNYIDTLKRVRITITELGEK